MPIEWVGTGKEAPEISGASYKAAGDPPLAVLHVWPNRSLSKAGFVTFISATFVLLLLPLLAVLGTPLMWGLMPFVFGTLALIWVLLRKSYGDGQIIEELTLWSDCARLTRQARRSDEKSWSANPYWVTVQVHKSGGPVESYLTLKGGGREVELGAFLSKDEREELFDQVRGTIADIVSFSRDAPPADTSA